jgi:hypothetical protein
MGAPLLRLLLFRPLYALLEPSRDMSMIPYGDMSRAFSFMVPKEM